MHQLVSMRRKKCRQLHHMLISSIFLHKNSTKRSKMLINGTSLRSPHSIRDMIEIEMIAFLICFILMVRCHTLSFSIARWWYMTHSFLCIHQLFCIPKVNIKWITIGEILVDFQVFRWISVPLTVWPFLTSRL